MIWRRKWRAWCVNPVKVNHCPSRSVFLDIAMNAQNTRFQMKINSPFLFKHPMFYSVYTSKHWNVWFTIKLDQVWQNAKNAKYLTGGKENWRKGTSWRWCLFQSMNSCKFITYPLWKSFAFTYLMELCFPNITVAGWGKKLLLDPPMSSSLEGTMQINL